MQRTSNAPITSIGVFQYTMPDGTVRKELRTPEEVFHADSLATLKNVPLTMGHPTPANMLAKNFDAIGFVSAHPVEKQGRLDVLGSMKVFDDDIDIHDYSISAGYTCDVEPQSGVWCGIEYDHVQKNIKYNHASLVEKSRAGDNTSLKEVKMDMRMDNADATAVVTQVATPAPAPEVKTDNANPAPAADPAPAAAPAATPAAAPAEPAKPEETKQPEPAAEPAPAPATEAKTDSAEIKMDAKQLASMIEIAVATGIRTAMEMTKTDCAANPAPAAPAAEPAKPVVEMKTDAADKKEPTPREQYLANFYNQGGSK